MSQVAVRQINAWGRGSMHAHGGGWTIAEQFEPPDLLIVKLHFFCISVFVFGVYTAKTLLPC